METTLTPPPQPETPGSEPPALEPIPVEEPSAERRSSPLGRILHRLLRVLKSWLLAALFCLSIPGAILFSGWTYRFVQRRALNRWAKLLDRERPHPRTLPRWFLSDDFRGDLTTNIKIKSWVDWFARIFSAFLGSFGANLKAGFLPVLNSFLLTLPGGVIMLFSWYSGWDNSFNKGYEQAWVGPTLGFLGIGLFMAAMTYVPIAQARQAVTGSGKAFFNYRKIREVIRRRPVACLLLTAGYAATGAIFMVALSILTGAELQDWAGTLTNEQVIAFLNSYYFWWAVLFIAPAFVILKLLAGRIYAGAAFDLVTMGIWDKRDLRGTEVSAFATAPVTPNAPALPGIMTTSLRAFSGIGRFTLRAATVVLLFAFAAALYVPQFFNYQPAANWLRQPMVQLPWYHYIPDHLKEEGGL